MKLITKAKTDGLPPDDGFFFAIITMHEAHLHKRMGYLLTSRDTVCSSLSKLEFYDDDSISIEWYYSEHIETGDKHRLAELAESPDAFYEGALADGFTLKTAPLRTNAENIMELSSYCVAWRGVVELDQTDDYHLYTGAFALEPPKPTWSVRSRPNKQPVTPCPSVS